MPIEVLLVEDGSGDIRLTKESFRSVNESVRVHSAVDGVEAMAFLRQQGVHVGAPQPDLILLDLNLPKMDGREVLALIKSDENLRVIPTIVLTTSDSEADVLISYKLHASCYLRKPTHWDEFDSIVKYINAFWLAKAMLRGPVDVPPLKWSSLKYNFRMEDEIDGKD